MTTERLVRALVALLFLCLSCSSSSPDSKRSITVTGAAEIEIEPDQMLAFLSIATVNKDPRIAYTQNDEKVADVLKLLDELGVESNDVSTGYVRLGEKYRTGAQGKEIFEGYEAEKSIRAKLRDLGLHDRLIRGSLELGLNRIWGVSFESTEIVAKNREARVLAIRAAREKAEYLADELGCTVGPALSIKEIKPEPWEQSGFSNALVEERSSAASADALTRTLLPESIVVRQQIEVSFRLEGGS